MRKGVKYTGRGDGAGAVSEGGVNGRKPGGRAGPIVSAVPSSNSKVVGPGFGAKSMYFKGLTASLPNRSETAQRDANSH